MIFNHAPLLYSFFTDSLYDNQRSVKTKSQSIMFPIHFFISIAHSAHKSMIKFIAIFLVHDSTNCIHMT